jgi:protoporphyrinogen oxidase
MKPKESRDARRPRRLSILGGGPAGLAAGHYARKRGCSFTIFEKRSRTGGLCVTLERNGWRFDSGAHRFHDKIPEVTAELKALLGPDLRRINVPSKIYDNGRFVNFPLTPVNLVGQLGHRIFFRAGREILLARLRRPSSYPSFHHFAIRTYGRTLAGRFLLNYTEKLWGVPCERLSPRAAGERLRGLRLRTFLSEAAWQRRRRAPHLEGSFYYPRSGIGEVTGKLAGSCGEENIRTAAAITGIHHDGQRIIAIEVNGRERVKVDEVISTLPLDHFLSILTSPPPTDIAVAGRKLRFRGLVLVALFLSKESITPYATIYFPHDNIPQTRIYEPKNRSREMSPEGRTSLVAEIPCWPDDDLWSLKDSQLVETMKSQAFRLGWMRESNVLDAEVIRIPYAYPVLEAGYEHSVETIRGYLGRFRNLKLLGRNAAFRYEWIHNMMDSAREAIRGYEP